MSTTHPTNDGAALYAFTQGGSYNGHADDTLNECLPPVIPGFAMARGESPLAVSITFVTDG